MQVTPAINCQDFACAEEKVKAVQGFLPEGGWFHLDVADAVFTFHKTWGDPDKLPFLISQLPQFNWEIHLMVEHPESVAEVWLGAGAKRLIVHTETINQDSAKTIFALTGKYRASAMLSSNPETLAENLRPYLPLFSEFQVLAVTPGWAGQKFLPLVLEKIKFLRKELPNALIEVDGGINPGTTEIVKAAGANVVVVASYLFDRADHKSAFEELMRI